MNKRKENGDVLFESKKNCYSNPQTSHKSSLQAYPVKNFPYILKSKILSKRMSLFSFRRMKASITVEASFALPLFLFFIINLLSVILIFMNYSKTLCNMHQQASKAAIYAHALSEENSIGNDMVTLKQVIAMKPLIPIVGFDTSKTIVSCKMRKWTGYDVLAGWSQQDQEEWVYITPFGSAYHRRRSCSYLNLSLQCDSIATVLHSRNADYEKYRACEICAEKNVTGAVFYTNQGNRYHTSLQCSGLKRTVKTVPLSKVNGRHACSRCGGSNH